MSAQPLSSTAKASASAKNGAEEGGDLSEQAMSAVATVREQQVAVPQSADIIAVIERAALNPNVDIDKMERLLQMQERILERHGQAAFAEAMSAAQADVRPVAADAKNPQTKSNYATYAALDRAVRPIYVRHGFALSFNTSTDAPEDHVRVLCKVMHRGGHVETYSVDMPSDGKGARGGDVMTKTHAAGSAMSYGQRYLLKLIFNIAVGDDDDGNAAGKTRQPVSGAAEAAINSIGECRSLDDLRNWRETNDPAVQRLDRNDKDAVTNAWSARAREIRAEASQ